MPNGFFAGGMAEGMETARKADLAERELAQNFGLRTRAADLAEKQFAAQQEQEASQRGDKIIADLMSSVTETVKAGLATGKDPATIYRAVQPVLGTAQALAAKVGRDPAALDAQTRALLTGPTGVQAATAAGIGEGTKTAVAQKTAEGILTQPTAAGGTGEPSGFIIDPSKRQEAENKLRDDYVARNKEFITLRDFKDRMDTAPKTGAGDLALVFSYMKVLDPTSSVREGEYATAQNAAGVPSAIGALYNKLVGGGKLDNTARTQIKEAADQIWMKASERQSALTNQFTGIAKRYGLNPKNVIIDFNPSSGSIQGVTPSGLKYKTIQQ